MAQTFGFDVYGTLVDPVDMLHPLKLLIGNKAKEFAQLWHEKKVEYAFRRGLMKQYQNFEVCTLQALHYCMITFQVKLSEKEQLQLMSELSNLNAFPDVISGLSNLKAQGHTLAAFSNGSEKTVRSLMEKSGILPQLHQVISVDDISSFKPNPKVYEYLVSKTKSNINDCWMVSSNPWDVIGAKAAGLKAIWVKRDSTKVFDPWEIEPDLVVNDLLDMSEHFAQES